MNDATTRPLPRGWRWVRLGEVCEPQTGTRDPRLKPDRPFLYVDITSVDNTTKRIVAPKTLIGREAPSRARQLICAGDVIVSTTRPNLNAVAFVPPNLDGQICSTGFCVLRAHRELDRGYLFAFVQSPDFVWDVSKLVKGALYPAVTEKQVLAQHIPLPPLAEQQRIASILSEQVAAVGRARAAAEARLEAAKALPAAYLRAVFNSPEAQEWPRRRLGEVALLVQNGIYKSAENYGHGHPFLRMYNIPNDSWCLNLKTMAQVKLQDGERETFGLGLGDLLISRVNSFELVGKCAWVGPEAEGYVFENMLIRVRLSNSVDSLFVAQQMSNGAVRKQIENVAKRAIGQASINSVDLKGIQVVLPPLPQQQRIAAALSEQMEAVEQARKALQEEVDTTSKLPAALLRRAFSGGL